ncbi:MAG TPA: hypothetical protein VJ997_15490 [Longimicrobiales bacterium]|nr:hypothetical protein [Longimicrobiales bacterium]
MTLTFAAAPELTADAPRVVEALRRRGVAVLPMHAPASAVAALGDGSLDLFLARGDGGEDLMDARALRAVAVLRREEPRDVLIPADGRPPTLALLPPRSRVGVAGHRRRGFLLAHRRDLVPVAPWNGGGPVEALRSGAVDGLVLGAAEARRMSLGHLASEALDSKAWVPSAGQGSLVLFGRHDAAMPKGMAAMDHPASRVALAAERACLSTLGGAADAPLGVLAMPHGKWIRVWGMIASAGGTRVVRGDLTGAWDRAEEAGRTLAELLLARGAGPLMSRMVRSIHP